MTVAGAGGMGGETVMELRLTIDGREETFTCLERDGGLVVRSRSRVAQVRVRRRGGGWCVEVDGRVLPVRAVALPPLRPGAELRFLCAGREHRVGLPGPARRVVSFQEPEADGLVAAGHLGRVTEVCIRPGVRVRRGQVLCRVRTVELVAEVAAPADGTVAEVCVRPGAPVRPGTPVCRLAGS